ncbi:MAG: DUF3291 domain-containing protein [Aestuariibacter sp.]
MHLAQLNIARARFPMDSPEIKEFVDNLEYINGIADQSEGFIWRLLDENGDATSIQAFDDPNMLINMSVWKDPASLKAFLFESPHKQFLMRRKEWFFPIDKSPYVLWWIAEDTTPDITEAKERLLHLHQNGDSAYAFTFRKLFAPEEALKQQAEC